MLPMRLRLPRPENHRRRTYSLRIRWHSLRPMQQGSRLTRRVWRMNRSLPTFKRQSTRRGMADALLYDQQSERGDRYVGSDDLIQDVPHGWCDDRRDDIATHLGY